MDTNYWTSYLLWTGLACNVVILCMIYYKGTHPKKRKASDKKHTLIVVYRNPGSLPIVEGKDIGIVWF